MHLWESKHPYHMSEGYYHTEWKSLDDFMGEFADSDMDYNYIVRWDWLEGRDCGAGEYNGDDNYRNGRLLIQFVGQRKALLFSHEISVCRADEPRVIEFLRPRFQYAMELWTPMAQLSVAQGL